MTVLKLHPQYTSDICKYVSYPSSQDLLLFSSQEVLEVLGASDASAGSASEQAAAAKAVAAATAAAATAAAATAAAAVAAMDSSRRLLAAPRRAGELMQHTQVQSLNSSMNQCLLFLSRSPLEKGVDSGEGREETERNREGVLDSWCVCDRVREEGEGGGGREGRESPSPTDTVFATLPMRLPPDLLALPDTRFK